MKFLSNFLDKMLLVKSEPKKIASVFGPDNLRIGIISAREFRKGFSVEVKFCFLGKNGHKPAFFGWSNDTTVEDFIKNRYPDSKIAPNHPMDSFLDQIENLLNN